MAPPVCPAPVLDICVYIVVLCCWLWLNNGVAGIVHSAGLSRDAGLTRHSDQQLLSCLALSQSIITLWSM